MTRNRDRSYTLPTNDILTPITEVIGRATELLASRDIRKLQGWKRSVNSQKPKTQVQSDIQRHTLRVIDIYIEKYRRAKRK